MKIVEPHEVANTFAKYFSSVGNMLENNLALSDQCPVSHIDRNSNSFVIYPATQQEVTSTISKFKNTCTDLNNVSVKIFKSVGSRLSAPLAQKINKSFSTGVFPESLKCTKITPVFKKENKPTPLSNLYGV